MLDAVIDYFHHHLMFQLLKDHYLTLMKKYERHADDEEPFSALAFKVMTDPYVGKLTFFRVYSGTLKVWIICTKLN